MRTDEMKHLLRHFVDDGQITETPHDLPSKVWSDRRGSLNNGGGDHRRGGRWCRSWRRGIFRSRVHPSYDRMFHLLWADTHCLASELYLFTKILQHNFSNSQTNIIVTLYNNSLFFTIMELATYLFRLHERENFQESRKGSEFCRTHIDTLGGYWRIAVSTVTDCPGGLFIWIQLLMANAIIQ